MTRLSSFFFDRSVVYVHWCVVDHFLIFKMSQSELLSYLFLEEIEEEEFLLDNFIEEHGNAIENPLFFSRPEEGFFSILINRY